MTHIRTLVLSLVAFTLVLGTAVAAGVAFDARSFDAYLEDNDEGYVDIVKVGDVLTVIFDEEMGSLPATMEGATLPVDEDFDEFRLLRDTALALYGGLPVETSTTTVLVEVDGDADVIHDALLARLNTLGVTVEPEHLAGPIRSYDLSDGDASWRLAFTDTADGGVIHLQAF
ncbi:MAG: hypothetical protein U5K81_00495 [Trueperaceae bacterium]|nr:hypothetical protein [Trueperaceae bacterium]